MPRVSTLFVFACIATAAGAYLARDLGNGAVFPTLIGFIASYIFLMVVRRREVLNVIALYAFSLMTGVWIGPVLNAYAHSAGGYQLIGQAMLISSAVFAGAASFGWFTSTNLAPLRRYLIGGLLALIAVGLLSFFFAFSSGVSLGFSLGIVVIFVGFTAIDFQRLRRNYPANEYILATVSIYLDFLNIFLAVLNILGGGRRN
jgi:FtsH-binding integral membrane protein